MSRRDNVEARCDGCHLHASLCICGLIPQLRPRSRLALLVHYREARKPTNTGQLAARCLDRSRVCLVGDREHPLPSALWEENELPLLLYPDADAVPLAQFADCQSPVVLIVPDGNWRQAGKMRKRVPGLANVQCVTLPETEPTSYRLRSEPRSGGLATLEAIAHAMRILEGQGGEAIASAMLAVFRVMVERTLWLRGSLPSDQVTGGIPQAAVAKDPRGTH